MRGLKLHTRQTILASGVTLLVIAALVWMFSVRVADLLREDQKQLAALQAESLAEQLSLITAPTTPTTTTTTTTTITTAAPPHGDAQELRRILTLVRNARPNTRAVRLWERQPNGGFSESLAAENSLPATEMPEEKQLARGTVVTHTTIAIASAHREADDSLYRVFAPVYAPGGNPHGSDSTSNKNNKSNLNKINNSSSPPLPSAAARIIGAVEIVEQLDDVPAVAIGFERTALWMAGVAVFVIALTTSALFRRSVYRPLEQAASELERRNRELEIANHELEAANEQMWLTTQRLTQMERFAAAGQTAAQFAHEVGTPLNLISGHVQLLQASPRTDERASEKLALIDEQIERIAGIVRRMLDRTRPPEVPLQNIDLTLTLHRFFEAVEPLLHARAVKLHKHISDNLPLIAGDNERLQQLFINLTNNALDAMPDGGKLTVTAQVVESFRVTGEQSRAVVIEFSDTGVGMSSEVQTRIFDSLFTTKQRGTGLGLSIARQTMREHGGSIKVKSTPPHGAHFQLTFPVT